MPSSALTAPTGELLKKVFTTWLSADLRAVVSASAGVIEEAALGRLAGDEALVLEPLEHGPNRRAADLVVERLADLADHARPALVENIDDLPLAWGKELSMRITLRYICSTVLHL